MTIHVPLFLLYALQPVSVVHFHGLLSAPSWQPVNTILLASVPAMRMCGDEYMYNYSKLTYMCDSSCREHGCACLYTYIFMLNTHYSSLAPPSETQWRRETPVSPPES